MAKLYIKGKAHSYKVCPPFRRKISLSALLCNQKQNVCVCMLKNFVMTKKPCKFLLKCFALYGIIKHYPYNYHLPFISAMYAHLLYRSHHASTLTYDELLSYCGIVTAPFRPCKVSFALRMYVALWE